jgi:hypothetical protein
MIRGGGTPGMHPDFPGLVILLKSSAPSQSLNANANLAGLFQIIGLPNTLGPAAGISSVGTSASASPASTGATGASGASASPSPAGTAATTTTSSTDNQTAEGTWFVDQSLWGNDVDVELTAFVVDGDAPATVNDRSSLKIVSNEVTVRFHINGGATAPSGTAKPSASASPASPAASPSGTAKPSASPSSTP